MHLLPLCFMLHWLSTTAYRMAGITCHFCRQKKLCGEEGCPRCSRRSTTADCIGKSDCSRCHSATGRFCRACLLIRYGQTLEVSCLQREVLLAWQREVLLM